MTNRQIELTTRPLSVSEQVWNDFIALRRAKRAPVTPTVIQGLIREAERAGMTLQQAMELCCAMGWQGFRAEWAERVNAVRRGAPQKPNADELARANYQRARVVDLRQRPRKWR